MVDEAQQFTVRADYPHALITVSQRFVSSVHVLEPSAFLDAIKRLTADAPRSRSVAEAVMAWFALKDAVARGADCHHAWFHQCLDRTPCKFRCRPLNAPMAFESLAVISAFNDWAIEYVWGFDAMHCWPPAIKASALLRADPDKVWLVEDLARAVYVSSATLERSFRRTFGVTAMQYHARLRLRGVVERVRNNDASIEGNLLEGGYRSPKDAYRLFRRLTGMTLSDVRALSDIEYASLLEELLALPHAEWRTDRTGASGMLPKTG
jgi:AraC-like DNA-binding protein